MMPRKFFTYYYQFREWHKKGERCACFLDIKIGGYFTFFESDNMLPVASDNRRNKSLLYFYLLLVFY